MKTFQISNFAWLPLFFFFQKQLLILKMNQSLQMLNVLFKILLIVRLFVKVVKLYYNAGIKVVCIMQIKTTSSLEPLGQFQPNLAQCILG